MSDPRIGFIGAGTLATGLAMAFASRGYCVAAVTSRTPASAHRLAAKVPGCRVEVDAVDLARRCEVVFITTSDRAIGLVASSVQWRPGQGVVHCSGSQSLAPLECAAAAGASIGSFHPFQTLACLETPEQALDRLAGVTYAVEGCGWVVEFLEEAATRLGGRAVRLTPEDRPLYHASAVLACGFLVTLLKVSADVWQEAGFSRDEAYAALLPLVKATIANIEMAGPAHSVTGPLVRGDADTVAHHLKALSSRMPHLLPLYRALGLESLDISRGEPDGETEHKLRALFESCVREG